MPRILVGKKSLTHRSACLVLYHGLLSRSSRLPLPSTGLEACRRFIRFQFKRNKPLESPSQIAVAVEAGHEALDLLDSASNGCSNSLQRLAAVLAGTAHAIQEQHIKAQADRSAATPIVTTGHRARVKAENRRLYSHTGPNSKKTVCVIDGPRPTVRGRRRIPTLTSVQGGIPLLRFKSPQPPELSRVIRQKLNTRITRWHKMEDMDSLKGFGTHEDLWDDIIRCAGGLLEGEVGVASGGSESVRDHRDDPCPGIDDSEEKWDAWGERSRADFSSQIREQDVKNMEMARTMFDIVQKERWLANVEKINRSESNRQAKIEKKERSDKALSESREAEQKV